MAWLWAGVIAAGLVTGVVWLDMRSAVTDTGHNPSAEEPDVQKLKTCWESQVGDACVEVCVETARMDGESIPDWTARPQAAVAAAQKLNPPK